MKTLKAGDIRKEGDQFRSWRERGAMAYHGDHSDKECVYTPWAIVDTLIGEPILQSDLMHLEFRRPTP